MKASKRRRSRLLVVMIVILLALVIGVVTAVSVSIRVETGEWRVPTKGDFIRIARRFDNRPSKTIYLERNKVELKPGEDYAAEGISSVIANASNQPARSKGWTGGDAKWKQLVACVEKMFAPFDVVVTDKRPSDTTFMMVVVGGTPADIGIKNSHHVSGLAPFHGGVIPRAVVFAFSGALKNDVQATCETIAMEVAHSYGLDHEYLCKDVMTYLHGCGSKSFVDADAPCGESRKRTCEGGTPTQNSYRQLVAVLGAKPAPLEPATSVAAPGGATTSKTPTTKTTSKTSTSKTPTTRTSSTKK